MSLPTFALHPAGIATLIEAGGPGILCEALAAGQTYSDVAKRFGGSRGALMRWINQLPPDVQQQIRDADTQGASALVEDTLTIADYAAQEIRTDVVREESQDGDLRERVKDAPLLFAAEKERIRVRQWFAERKDKDHWGQKAQVETVVNIQTIHLDALRHYHAPKLAQPIAVIEAPIELTLAELL